jgi:SAM-dependent methyltransferase
MEVTSEAYFEYLSGKGQPRLLLRLDFFFRAFYFRSIARELNGTVLDIGCGLGHFLQVYRQAVGMDINRHCVEYCLARGFKCLQGSIYHIPFPNGFFDGIVVSHVLEHLDDPDTAVVEVSRALKPGGRLSVRVPSASGFKVDSTHKIYFDYPRLASVLEKHGFEIISSRYYPIPWRAVGELITYNELRVTGVKKTDERS